MTGSTAVATVEPLLLTRREVPLSAVVYVCEPGTSEPAEPDGKRLPPLRKLIGGVNPMEAKLYPLLPHGQLGGGYGSGTPDEARFTPVEVFSPEDAPPETEFAVFLHGERMHHEGRRGDPDWYNQVTVYKYPDGWFASTGYHVCPMELSPEAQLVPTSEVGKGKAPR